MGIQALAAEEMLLAAGSYEDTERLQLVVPTGMEEVGVELEVMAFCLFCIGEGYVAETFVAWAVEDGTGFEGLRGCGDEEQGIRRVFGYDRPSFTELDGSDYEIARVESEAGCCMVSLFRCLKDTPHLHVSI